MSNCPECGLPGRPVLYGLIGSEAILQARQDGRLSLGGCVAPDPAPHFRCPALHEWRADFNVYDAAVEAVLRDYAHLDSFDG